jgi:hypothetical protein
LLTGSARAIARNKETNREDEGRSERIKNENKSDGDERRQVAGDSRHEMNFKRTKGIEKCRTNRYYRKVRERERESDQEE